MRILALIADRVLPAVTGTRVRNLHLWPAVKQLGHEVRLLGLDLQRASEPLASGPPGVQCDFVRPTRLPAWRRAIGVATRSHHEWPTAPELAAALDRCVQEWRPDVVHAEELRMAAFLPVMRGARSSAIETLTLHNVESDLIRRTGSTQFPIAPRLFGALHRASLDRFERRAVGQVDLALAYSEVDRARFATLYPDARWGATRNGANVSGVAPVDPPIEPRLLLVGSLGYAPNARGLEWFIGHVLPHLPDSIGVTVAGSRAPPTVRELLATVSSRITFVDTPPELDSLYASHGLCTVPLLEGSGTRGRILESLAYQRVVVTTTKGAEGLNLGDTAGVIIEDEPRGFAEAIVRWSSSSDQRDELARRGRQNVMRQYDWSVVAAELLRWFESCESR